MLNNDQHEAMCAMEDAELLEDIQRTADSLQEMEISSDAVDELNECIDALKDKVSHLIERRLSNSDEDFLERMDPIMQEISLSVLSIQEKIKDVFHQIEGSHHILYRIDLTTRFIQIAIDLAAGKPQSARELSLQ